MESGRRNGHGRVVMIYYELCESIWGGSPATEQIDGRLRNCGISDDMILEEMCHVIHHLIQNPMKEFKAEM